MKNATPLKQKTASRSASDKPASSARGAASVTIASTAGPTKRHTLSADASVGGAAATRQRGASAGSSNGSRAGSKKPGDFTNFLSPRTNNASSSSPTTTPVRGATVRARAAAHASPTPSPSASPRQRVSSSAQQGGATSPNPTRRRSLQAPALVSATESRQMHKGTAEDAPRYETLEDPRRTVRRPTGTISPSRTERKATPASTHNSSAKTAAAPPATEAAAPTQSGKTAAAVKAETSTPRASENNASKGNDEATTSTYKSPAAFKSITTATPAEGASSPLKTPPRHPVPAQRRESDELDKFDLGLAARLGEFPMLTSATAGSGGVTAPPDEAPRDVLGTPPSQALRRKSSAWSSEQTSRSLLLGGSGATLAPSQASRRQTLTDGDGGAAASVEAESSAAISVPAVVVGNTALMSAALSPGPSTASNSPLKLTTTLPVSSLSKTGQTSANWTRPKSTEKTTTLRQTTKTTNIKSATAHKSGTTSEELRSGQAHVGGVAPHPKESHAETLKDSGQTTPRTQPSSNRALTSATPAKSAAAGKASGPGGASPRHKTPTKSASPRPVGKAGDGTTTKKPRGGTPVKGTAATATDTTASSSAPPSPVKPRQTTLQSQRAAAMLSHMLSVVRPMAPVVHVRIRPVLPSIGEANHQRHVYLLDHENVMITGTRAGASASGTAKQLLSTTTDYAAAKRIETGGRAGFGSTGRNPSDFLSASSSVVLANSSNSGRRCTKTTSPPAAGTRSGAVAAGVAITTTAAAAAAAAASAATPATLYSGTSARLHNVTESPTNSNELANSLSRATAHPQRPSPTATPSSATMQPLGFPGVAPPPIGCHEHPRSASWLSQGSEDVTAGSRQSGGSHSTSPHQLGLVGGGPSTMLNSTASTPRAGPRLAAFRALPDDTPLSPATTPRGLTASGPIFGAERGDTRLAGRRPSATLQQSISLSAMTAPGSRATTRKNSMVSAVSPQKSSGKGAGGMRRPPSRSMLGASVSVSAMSMPTVSKDAAKSPAADDLRNATPPSHDVLRGSNTFSGAAAAGVAGTTNGAEQHYSFEFVHDEEATQADVFEESVLRFADEALLAQNVAIICYGPTGSGKTYSMMGSQAQPQTTAGGKKSGAALAAAKAAAAAAHKKAAAAASAHGRSAQGKGGASPRGGGESGRHASAAEGRRRLSEDAEVSVGGDQRERSVGLRVDDDSDDNDWPQLGSSWQYGYTDRLARQGPPMEGGREETGAGGGWRRGSSLGPSGVSGGAAMTSATMAEMGILPRLVHTLLERRGEAITIRREAGREEPVRSNSATASSAQPTPRATTAPKISNLSLTLRDLTFYGIELYMDELCDLLDPGKRPIQTVSDTGGLAALCQRINEARDYRINGNRGGASQVCVTSPRAGGGMPITSLADLRRAYRLAHGNRVTSKHAQNDTSSRSHAIFLLQLDFDLTEGRADTAPRRRDSADTAAEDSVDDASGATVQRVHSYVAMVDLAGCERVKQTKVEGAALREAQYINKSLSALSSVVLSLHRNTAHVPYRDSKLTRLLRPCLEGGRVLTLVHVAPCSSTETVSTLKFADQIRHTHIPTHALTPTSSKHRELLDVFADLIDPMQGLWEAQVRHAQQQLHRLCADVRLAYFSRAMGEISRHVGRRGLSPGSMPSDVVSDVSALTEADGCSSLSPGDVSLEDGPPPLTEDATEAEKRRFALHSIMHGLMGPIHHHQRTSMQDAIRAIRHRKEHKVESHHRQLQQRIDKLEAALQKLTATNAKLAAENRTPLPRDPYALELNRQLRETGEQISETAKEQAALSTLTAALRQRLLNQDTLEATVDAQLRKVQHRTAQALQTLSAAAAAHPPGVAPPASGSSSPREPTLPTGSPVPAAIAMETDDDPELRDIAHQQISLARELAALRLETACFEIASATWEGLWARAMRKEIMTALEVEAFAMERILLDRRALSMMMMTNTAEEEEGGDKHDSNALSVSGLLNSSELQTPPAANARDGHNQAVRAASLNAKSHGTSSERTTAGTTGAAWRSSLWTRLGNYLHGTTHVAATPTPANTTTTTTAADAAAEQQPAAAAETASSGAGSPQTPPLPSWRRERGDATLTTTTTNSESSEPRSSDGPQQGRSALNSRPASPPRAAVQRPSEEAMPNPLTILALAHDEAMRSAEQHPRQPPPPPLEQPPNPPAASTPPPSPRHAEAATASTAVVAAALLPLTISGTYGDEQAMQEACLQLLLRDGIPCEVCCMGNSAQHVLQHYVLPGTADAPLAEEVDPADRPAVAGTSSTAAAAVHYTVRTAAPSTTPRNVTAAGGEELDASMPSISSPRGGFHASHNRPSSLKNASCTTRVGRLRLARMPRRPNCYVLEFVYTHQGLPMSPRLQAALAGKPEEALSPTPRRTNLEQMVDALPSVHGVAGRGGARAQGPLKEHRLFAIPLYEPSLHLHLHVLEEGIPDMTTPVAATRPVATSAAETAAAATHTSAAASSSPLPPPLCVARRVESGSQLVLEVQGLPYTASTRRAQVVAAAATAKEGKKSAALHKSRKQQKANVASKSGKKGDGVAGSNEGKTATYQQLATGGKGLAKSAVAAAAEPAPAPAPGTSGWSDLVLAKRLSSGGELMLPSSCILSNKGCCSLVLRFPHPFFSPMARTENVEAVVGALCGILRPALTEPEVRLSSRSPRSPSRKGATSRHRRSTSPGTAPSNCEKGGSAGGARRRRGSQSHSHQRDDVDGAAEMDVITYAHVPYTMFSTETPALVQAAAPASVERSASSSAYVLPSPARAGGGAAVAGRVARTPSSQSASAARSDSFDCLGGSGSGVLGHAVQSSCSPAHGQRARLGATAAAAETSFASQLSTSPARASSSSVATVTAAAADQQNGATLQVQFHWVPTPLEVEPPRGADSRTTAALTRLNGDVHAGDEGGEEAELKSTPRQRKSVSVARNRPRHAGDQRVRQQLRAALAALAQLSYVFVEGRPAWSDSDSVASAASALSLHDGASSAGGERENVVGAPTHPLLPADRTHTAAVRYTHAMAVAALLRQLDTYRQRIRRLFRQQLYDAEDVLGDEVQISSPGRASHMRDIQAEVRDIIGLPSSAAAGGMGAAHASSLSGSPVRVHGGAATSTAHARHALLEPEAGDAAPDTQVTIPEAREACGAVVPWTVWQWAYRWPQVRRLLLCPPPPSTERAAVRKSECDGNTSAIAGRADAAAAWLPLDTRPPFDEGQHDAVASLHSGHAIATPTAAMASTSGGYASSSSSSSEGYVMEGDWLNEARFAARSKRVWLPDVLSATIPSYLESCSSDYVP